MNRSFLRRSPALLFFGFVLSFTFGPHGGSGAPPTATFAAYVAKISGYDTTTGDQFGVSVAIDGDLAVVGAYWDDDAGEASGAAYVFGRHQGGLDHWGELKKLTASDATTNDWFGVSVGISGDVIVVGAALNDDDGANSGAVYIFQRDAGGTNNWGEVQKLRASDASTNDWFGWSVEISGTTIAVGAYLHDGPGNDSGAAYIYEHTNSGTNQWHEVKRLTAEGATPAWFGWSLALQDETLVVGAPLSSEVAADGTGSAYIFARHHGGSNHWGQVQKLLRTGVAAGDQFGWSVAVNDGTAAVGARRANVAGTDSGGVFLFGRDQGGTNNWGEIKSTIPDDVVPGDWFGESVALRGDVLLVGMRLDDDLGNASGSAYLFRRDAGGKDQWGQVRKLRAFDGAAEHRFGESVAIGEDIIVVGAFADEAPGFGFAAGAAYLFRYGIVPTLAITHAETNLVVSWEPPSPEWILERTASLSPPSWTDVVSGSNSPVFIRATNSAAWFRLRRP